MQVEPTCNIAARQGSLGSEIKLILMVLCLELLEFFDEFLIFSVMRGILSVNQIL